MEKSLKIKTFGAIDGPLVQLPRIIKGFQSLGHEVILEGLPDLIYSNDTGGYKEAIEYKKKCPQSKLIFTCLDYPWHIKEINEWKDQRDIDFMYPDAVCAISETVKTDLLRYFPQLQKNGVNVIYQPIKSIKPLNLKRNDNLLFVGRANDVNKRVNIAIELAAMFNRILTIVGPEDVTPFLKSNYKQFVNYIGLVSDEELNKYYNECAAVIISSKNEGLCLPLLEGIASKTPVVVCEDMTTSTEFAPKEFISRTNLHNLYDKLQYVTSDAPEIKTILDRYSEKYIKQFSPIQIAKNIISVYEKIK